MVKIWKFEYYVICFLFAVDAIKELCPMNQIPDRDELALKVPHYVSRHIYIRVHYIGEDEAPLFKVYHCNKENQIMGSLPLWYPNYTRAIVDSRTIVEDNLRWMRNSNFHRHHSARYNEKTKQVM